MKKLIVADFDDTIFSREEQLNKEKILRENRWDAWNKVMKDILGFEYMIKNYYKNKTFPKSIISKMKENDIILTAWMKDYQKLKQKACWLENIKMIVVEKAEQKIEKLIEYVKNLDFIPDLIEIYEDRPKYFLEYKDVIENVLKTKVGIYYVEMNGNKWYKKIELIT